MRRLVIETTSPCLSVALFDGEVLLAADHRHIGRGHAEQLLPSIARLPDGGRADVIWVGCGPGSFTGTRIGIAAARALAFAWSAELSGFDSASLLAVQVSRLAAQDNVAVACASGHGEWLVGDTPWSHQSLPPASAAAHVAQAVVGGDCAAALVALRGWGRAIEADVDAREAPALPPAAMLTPVRPMYARAPDAALPAATPGRS